jgi:hypothetical protein
LLVGSLLLAAGCGDQITVVEDGTSGSGGESTTGGGAAGAGAGSTGLGLDGDHTLAVSVTIAPAMPFIASASIAARDVTLVWLDAMDRTTPVSSPVTIVFDEAGSVQAELDIPGQANAISGSDVIADVTISFERTMPSACGAVDGKAIVGGADIPIDGSTFALGSPETSTQPVINCAGDLAGPPP